MSEATGRHLAELGTVLPAAVISYMVWFAIAVCSPDWAVECPLAHLDGVSRGLACMSVMGLAGGLLSLLFSSLDRALGLGIAPNCRRNHGGQH